MLLEILGSGCAKCKTLHQSVLQVVDRLGLSAEVRKVEDMAEIMSHGVLSTPALVRDGKVLFAGKLPSTQEIERLLAS
ncbi:MAG: TM0996/MTH895 family glutaredoxin-like protein [Fibrobacteria bacterium]|nr:TM0996/MTH895 family glutaredoxin-like protein [Fibrobacteria bacterium]